MLFVEMPSTHHNTVLEVWGIAHESGDAGALQLRMDLLDLTSGATVPSPGTSGIVSPDLNCVVL